MAQFIRQCVQVKAGQQHLQSIGTHLGNKLLRVSVIQHLVLARQLVHDVQVFFLGQEVKTVNTILFLDSGLNNNIALIINDLIKLLGG